MRHYHNLLYISRGASDEAESLKQALSLAHSNQAPLKMLVLCPEFPGDLAQYQKQYEESLLKQAEESVRLITQALNLKQGDVNVSIERMVDKTPAISIIRHVLQQGYDLVIKEAEPRDKKEGFKAIDMELLRKCPCALWLTRPVKHSGQQVQVAVAIDPKSTEPASANLSIRMLELSHSLADSFGGQLHIISCWEYVFEEYLRGNAWVKVPDEELNRTVNETQKSHRAALEELISTSGLSAGQRIHHLQGKAEERIPEFVKDSGIDILVMGTVARTGIPGFIIGNTAENILQKLDCSLLALKPNGFISPVKAY